MKTLRLSATLMLLGTITLGTAATVDEKIDALENATPQKRFELMNELKKDLSALGEQERTEAMSRLRNRTRANSEDGEKLQTQEQTRERIRINQMQQTEEMKRSQNMYQHQAGGQAVQQGVTGGGSANRFMGRK